jgi:hypothetical protein
MSELDRSLHQLGGLVDWPGSPQLAMPSGAQVRSRRPLVLLLAAVVALGVAFAVPGARSAILRVLDLGGDSIERVDVLPPARERTLGASLGAPVSVSKAARALGGPVRQPSLNGRPQLFLVGGVVSVLLLAAPEPVLLSEFHSGDEPYVLKKMVGDSTDVESLQVDGAPGVWISGVEHVFIAPSAPPRLAGNTLLWQRRGITYRLEGHSLTERLALRLAGEIDGT